MTTEMDDAAAALIAQEASQIRQDISELTKVVTTFAVAMNGQLDGTTRRTRLNWYAAIVLVFSLTFNLGYSYYLYRNESQIQKQQEITSSIVLCPVWNLLLSSYHPELRPAGPLRDQYIQSFLAITIGRDALHCAGSTAPVPSPTAKPKPHQS